jgi:glutamate-1-semialdehyde 2,1-aminomutase
MAIRMARGFTGRNKLLRFQGHFHGWHDDVVVGIKAPFDRPTSTGIPAENLARLVILPPNDLEAVQQALTADPDIAGIILEPAGGSNAAIPTRPGFLAGLRELATAHHVVLIFDEVISGFRYAPGGAQAYFGVLPDLTTLAKIVAGGLPGGAVAGKAEIMEQIAFKGDPEADRFSRIMHTGTFNANPLSAAAGIAMLKIAATGEPQKRAGDLTLRLIDGMNDILRQKRLPGCVYGDISGFHLLIGQEDLQPDDATAILDAATPARLGQAMGKLTHAVRAALLLEGIDTSGASGRLSSAHTDEDLAQTLASFDRALDRLLRWEVF